jgi:hypothetical protein
VLRPANQIRAGGSIGLEVELAHQPAVLVEILAQQKGPDDRLRSSLSCR